MTVVVDASTVIAALVDDGPDGRWAESFLTEALVAAQHLPVEVASVLRRSARSGTISDDVASLAHQNLLDLSVTYVPYEPVATRAWALRANVTPYDAWYVAIAEEIDAPLATLDRRLVRAPGPRCTFLVPDRRRRTRR